MAGAIRSFAVAAASRAMHNRERADTADDGAVHAIARTHTQSHIPTHTREDTRARKHNTNDRGDRASTGAKSRPRQGSRSTISSVPPGTGRRRGDSDDEFTSLQTRRLAALSEDVFTPAYLRRFFRMLDADHSHEVSAAEIQRGLLALGFDQCRDPTVLSRLLCDIDDDRTGTITESEFLTFFSQITRTGLHAKLNSYAKDYVLVRATVYGKDLVAESFTVSHKALKTVLEVVMSRLGPSDHLWLDIVGYSADVYATISERFGLNPDVLTDSLVFQSPKLDLSAGLDTDEATRALVLLHAMKLIRSPIEPDVGTLDWVSHYVRTRAVYAFTQMCSCGRRRGRRGRDAACCACCRGSDDGPAMKRTLSEEHGRAPSSGAAKAGRSKSSSLSPSHRDPRRRISAAIEDAVAAGQLAAGSKARPPVRISRSRSSNASEVGSLIFGDIPREGSLQELDQIFQFSKVGAGGVGMRLVNKSSIRDDPPDISMEQVAVVVVDERVILTLRGSAVDGDDAVESARTATDEAATAQPAVSNRMLGTTSSNRVHPVDAVPPRSSVMSGPPVVPLLRSASDGAIPTSMSPSLRQSSPMRGSISMRDGVGVSTTGAIPKLPGSLPSQQVRDNTEPVVLTGFTEHHIASSPQSMAGSSRGFGKFTSGVSSRSGAIAAAVRAAADGALTRLSPRSKSMIQLPTPRWQAEVVDDYIEAGEIGSLFGTLRSRLLAGAGDVSHLISGSAKALAVDLVDSVLQTNFSIRDVLKDWEDVLAADIRKFPSGHHTSHLYALERLGKLYNNALQPLRDALDPSNWEGEDAGEDFADDAGLLPSDDVGPGARASMTLRVISNARDSMTGAVRAHRSSQSPGTHERTSSDARPYVGIPASRQTSANASTNSSLRSASIPPPIRAHPLFALEKQGSDVSMLSGRSAKAPSSYGTMGSIGQVQVQLPSSSPPGTTQHHGADAASSMLAPLGEPDALTPRMELNPLSSTSPRLLPAQPTRDAPPPPPRDSVKPQPRPPPRDADGAPTTAAPEPQPQHAAVSFAADLDSLLFASETSLIEDQLPASQFTSGAAVHATNSAWMTSPTSGSHRPSPSESPTASQELGIVHFHEGSGGEPSQSVAPHNGNGIATLPGRVSAADGTPTAPGMSAGPHSAQDASQTPTAATPSHMTFRQSDSEHASPKRPPPGAAPTWHSPGDPAAIPKHDLSAPPVHPQRRNPDPSVSSPQGRGGVFAGASAPQGGLAAPMTGAPLLTRGRSLSNIPTQSSSARPPAFATQTGIVPPGALQLNLAGLDGSGTTPAGGPAGVQASLAAVAGVATARSSVYGGAMRQGPVTARGSIVQSGLVAGAAGGRLRAPSRTSALMPNMVGDRVTSPYSAGTSAQGAPQRPFIPPTAARFFRRHIAEFAELADDLSAMCSDLAKQKSAVEALQTQLTSLQNAQMNRTLYMLTLITALSVPVTFLTGLWGMNFEDMDELSPDKSAYGGYKVFWTTISVVLSFVLFLFWKGGFFAMLK